ncbi:beta-lactamase class A [Faunimonas pinastri]|uniref:Beta-lactamase n=1 Tax=Faunimonas pinastri TaxID=1855383 RepID=A0A1H9K0F3_9HYPH|nr:class A beta-lactamase [Faunimonas pinastri]SEQ92579.1 beta-lactamase class A [Faunimonas pinastri]
MPLTLTRRGFAVFAGSALAGGVLGRSGLARAAQRDALAASFASIEKRLQARLGVAILDTETRRAWKHRAAERFPLCSTFKLLAAGAVLAKVDAGDEDPARRIRFGKADVVTYSPVTQHHVGDGMTLAEISAAALTQSDNTAGNLILDSIGGPEAVTRFARSLGDEVTRLDRRETALNEATPGDPRDTTSPEAMVADLGALLLGPTLSGRSREQLAAWMVANETGGAKLRAGLPKDWRVGDKTGGGDHGAMADVAIAWPPNRKPVIAAVYITETEASFDDRNAAIAEIGRALASALAG